MYSKSRDIVYEIACISSKPNRFGTPKARTHCHNLPLTDWERERKKQGERSNEKKTMFTKYSLDDFPTIFDFEPTYWQRIRLTNCLIAAIHRTRLDFNTNL